VPLNIQRSESRVFYSEGVEGFKELGIGGGQALHRSLVSALSFEIKGIALAA
jgi:hypothetical protein